MQCELQFLSFTVEGSASSSDNQLKDVLLLGLDWGQMLL